MNARLVLAALGIVVSAMGASTAAAAQASGALRRDIERRFEVLPLRDGLALRPRAEIHGIGSIELTDGTIAVDGVPVTGAELRDRLGSDADAIIQLSYLDPAERRRLLEAPPRRPERPSEVARSSSTPARTRRAENRIRLGGSITVSEDETVEGDVVAIGGSVTVYGQVIGNVVAIGGAVDLGPHADVGQDVVGIGGGVHLAEGAHIGGRLNDIGGGMVDLSGLRFRPWRFGRGWVGWSFGSLFALVSTIGRLIVLSLLVSMVMLVGHDYVARVGARAAAEPIKAAVVGVLAQLLFLPLLIVATMVMIITIIGIPLLALIPFALLALAVIFLVGFSAVAFDLGRRVTAAFGSPTDNPYAAAIVGIIAVLSPVLIGRLIGLAGGVLFPFTLALFALGFLLEYLAWTVGLGAVALVRFDRAPRS